MYVYRTRIRVASQGINLERDVRAWDRGDAERLALEAEDLFEDWLDADFGTFEIETEELGEAEPLT